MIYYIDTEFLEGPQDKRFLGFKVGETKPTIDLISIGIIAEYGTEYYAISKDFNLKEAWNRWQTRTGQGDRNITEPKEYWIRENVLRPIFKDLWYEKCHMQNLHHVSNDFTYQNLKRLIDIYGKTNKQIAEDVQNLCGRWDENSLDSRGIPEFYAYYADYDWVAFCWLFGRMIDLPDGFPMYCRDLKQMLDECYMHQANKHEGMSRLEAWLMDVKKYPAYPKQENEHNAIADARWNKRLHDFIKTLHNNTAELPPVSDGISNANTM
jgi:hypothetical protein